MREIKKQVSVYSVVKTVIIILIVLSLIVILGKYLNKNSSSIKGSSKGSIETKTSIKTVETVNQISVAREDCNDNDKCTKDSYNNDKNKCEYALITPCDGNKICENGEYTKSKDCPSCEDNNVCTTDSYDYNSKRCIHQENIPCCGDGICAINESCQEDCFCYVGKWIKREEFGKEAMVIKGFSFRLMNLYTESLEFWVSGENLTEKQSISLTEKQSRSITDKLNVYLKLIRNGNIPEITFYVYTNNTAFDKCLTEVYVCNDKNENGKCDVDEKKTSTVSETPTVRSYNPPSNNVLVTPTEENAGLDDSDIIKWCSAACRTYQSINDWTEWEYKNCFSACLKG